MVLPVLANLEQHAAEREGEEDITVGSLTWSGVAHSSRVRRRVGRYHRSSSSHAASGGRSDMSIRGVRDETP